MKISKFAFIFTFAIIAISNVSFGMNSPKDLTVQSSYEKHNIEEFKQNNQEENAENILQNKLNQLKEEKVKEKASWFNKLYLHKLYGEELNIFKDSLITLALSMGVHTILGYIIPKPTMSEKPTKDELYWQNLRTRSIWLLASSFNFGLGKILVQDYKTRIKINSEKIKNLEEILEEMNKNKFSN